MDNYNPNRTGEIIMQNCQFKYSCWNYKYIPCLFKKDSCELIPKLKQLRSYLYEETLEDARLQVEYGDLGLARLLK